MLLRSLCCCAQTSLLLARALQHLLLLACFLACQSFGLQSHAGARAHAGPAAHTQEVSNAITSAWRAREHQRVCRRPTHTLVDVMS